MPTGYTYHIEEGRIADAKDFLMLCARNFGACIMMRDEPLDKPIPKEFEADTTYATWATNARKELELYKKMSLADAAQQCKSEYEAEVARVEKSKSKDRELMERYNKVLTEVKKWAPPTTGHTGLKKFAIEQIEMCLPDLSYYDRQEPPKLQDAKRWLEERIKNCEDKIVQYEKQQEEENARTKSRNEWLRDLRDSL